jgi:hypothetical protein
VLDGLFEAAPLYPLATKIKPFQNVYPKWHRGDQREVVPPSFGRSMDQVEPPSVDLQTSLTGVLPGIDWPPKRNSALCVEE